MSEFTDLQERYQQSQFKPGFSALEKVVLYFPKNRSLQEQAAAELAALRAAVGRLEGAARLAFDTMQSLPFAGNALTAEHVRKLAEVEQQLAAALAVDERGTGEGKL
jgi:hypothetical protein